MNKYRKEETMAFTTHVDAMFSFGVVNKFTR